MIVLAEKPLSLSFFISNFPIFFKGILRWLKS